MPFFRQKNINVVDGLHEFLFDFEFRGFDALGIFDNIFPVAGRQLPVVLKVRDIGADLHAVDDHREAGLQLKVLDGPRALKALQVQVAFGLPLGVKLYAVHLYLAVSVFGP